VGRLADAIYEGRHGELEVEDDYEDYEGAEEEFDYDDNDTSFLPEEDEDSDE
jgi:small subunit ribosomal protein S2